MLADLVVHQIEAVDHYQAKSVEQCHHREQQRVSVGGEAPDGQMRGSEQGQEGQSVASQVPGHPLVLIGLHDQQCGKRDYGGKAQQQQFSVAPSRQRGRYGHRRLQSCRHAAARQSMPG